MFNKLICKRKEHDYTYTHVEPDGWGKFWYWKKCNRCDCYDYDKKEVGSVEAISFEMIGKPIITADGTITKGKLVCGEREYYFKTEFNSSEQKYKHPMVWCPDCNVVNEITNI